jgi:hypothetical protein
VGEVLHDGPPETSFPQQHDPVQAFAFDREHNSLGVSVQARTPGGQQQRLHPSPFQRLPELRRVPRTAVEDQVPLFRAGIRRRRRAGSAPSASSNRRPDRAPAPPPQPSDSRCRLRTARGTEPVPTPSPPPP